MQRVKDGAEKPEGWYWIPTHAPRRGFAFGIWGGSLRVPAVGLREWFVRLPFIGLAFTIGHLRAV